MQCESSAYNYCVHDSLCVVVNCKFGYVDLQLGKCGFAYRARKGKG